MSNPFELLGLPGWTFAFMNPPAEPWPTRLDVDTACLQVEVSTRTDEAEAADLEQLRRMEQAERGELSE